MSCRERTRRLARPGLASFIIGTNGVFQVFITYHTYLGRSKSYGAIIWRNCFIDYCNIPKLRLLRYEQAPLSYCKLQIVTTLPVVMHGLRNTRSQELSVLAYKV